MSFSPQSRGRSQTFSVDIAAHTLSPRSRGRARGISADNAAPTPGRSIKICTPSRGQLARDQAPSTPGSRGVLRVISRQPVFASSRSRGRARGISADNAMPGISLKETSIPSLCVLSLTRYPIRNLCGG